VQDPADIKLKRRMHAIIAAFEDAFIRSGFRMVRHELNQALFSILGNPAMLKEWYNSKSG